MATGLLATPWTLCACAFVYMMVIPTTRACRETIWQAHTPPAMHGRVFALQQTLGRGVMSIGSLICGGLAAAVSAHVDQDTTVAAGFVLMGALNIMLGSVSK